MAAQVTVLCNGHVFDGQRHRPDTAVAVVNGRIAEVGHQADVLARAGSGAEEVDLADGLVAPGFQDSHVHPMLGGLERLRCDLTDLSSREEYLAVIGDYAAAHPNDEWIRGGGWAIEAFGPAGPTAAELDAVVPDRPVFLPSTDHHDAWVNSRALEIVGVDADTPDRADGWFERDERGRPTGTVREAAMARFGTHLATSRSEYELALLEGQAYLHSLGITGWHDALLGGYAGIDDPTQAYLDAIAGGRLTARVRAALWWDRKRGPEQVEELLERREDLTRAGVDAGAVKLMMDGIAESYTAAMTDPYLGQFHCRCGDRGLAFMSLDDVREAVAAVDAAGLQAHFHAIGDRAVHDALDALEHARARNGGGGNRHTIAHLQLVRPADRRRFAELDVVANVQPLWAQREDQVVQLTIPHLDDERIGWHYPFADLLSMGARLAAGSDWPVSSPAPVAGVHVAVNRRPYGDDVEPFLRDQGIGLADAFAAYTSGAAYVNHRDDTGCLAPGRLADLVVLDRDPFAGAPEEIGAAQVAATYVDGDAVFHR